MTAYKLTAIVSGGQQGADRGAMDAAIELGLGWGGWAPAGWRSDDGEIPLIYRDRMKCTTSSEYGMRTRLNVQDSDGTLLVSFDPELTGGSKYTEETAERMRKPYLHLVLPDRGKTRVPDEVRAGVLEWIATARISILNVAGPRERKAPGIQQAVRDLLVWIFEPEAADDAPPTTPEEQATAEAVGQELHALLHAPDPVGQRMLDACKAEVAAMTDEEVAAENALDGTFTIPPGTPVRWGGVEPVESTATDPGAFTFVEGETVAIMEGSPGQPAVCVEGWETLKKWNAAEDAERNFIANCEIAAAALPDIAPELRSGALVEVKALVDLFYEFPNNGAGGSLRVVLDDGNAERENVEFCLKYAEDHRDAPGVALAKLLLALTDEEREAV